MVICAAVADHEFQVQMGTYENLVKTQAKYAQNELAISTDPDLRRQWARIKAAFNVQAYRDHKGVIRRTMGAERNLRPSFSVNVRRRGGHLHIEALLGRDAMRVGFQPDAPLHAASSGIEAEAVPFDLDGIPVDLLEIHRHGACKPAGRHIVRA